MTARDLSSGNKGSALNAPPERSPRRWRVCWPLPGMAALRWPVWSELWRQGLTFDLPALNAVLQVALVIAAVTAAGVARVDWLRLRAYSAPPVLAPVTVSEYEDQVETAPAARSLSYFLELAARRDLFAVADGSQKIDIFAADGAAGKKPSVLSQMVTELKLVGISWSDEPEAIIEAERAQKAFFVKKGQTLVNDIEVRDILRDRVLLRFGNETVELR